MEDVKKMALTILKVCAVMLSFLLLIYVMECSSHKSNPVFEPGNVISCGVVTSISIENGSYATNTSDGGVTTSDRLKDFYSKEYIQVGDTIYGYRYMTNEKYSKVGPIGKVEDIIVTQNGLQCKINNKVYELTNESVRKGDEVFLYSRKEGEKPTIQKYLFPIEKGDKPKKELPDPIVITVDSVLFSDDAYGGGSLFGFGEGVHIVQQIHIKATSGEAYLADVNDNLRWTKPGHQCIVIFSEHGYKIKNITLQE